MHVDLPRLREGQNGGAFWSVFVPCPANGTDFSDENYAESQLTVFLPALLPTPHPPFPRNHHVYIYAYI